MCFAEANAVEVASLYHGVKFSTVLQCTQSLGNMRLNTERNHNMSVVLTGLGTISTHQLPLQYLSKKQLS